MSCENARPKAHNRAPTNMRLASALALALLFSLPAATGAESEWTAGSPPPLDFGLQTTAAPSTTAPYTWLRSVDGGEAIEVAWNTSGVQTEVLIDTSGGVADGMQGAIAVREGARP